MPAAAHLPFVKAELRCILIGKSVSLDGRGGATQAAAGAWRLLGAHSGLWGRAGVAAVILKGFLCGCVRAGLTVYSGSELGHAGAARLFCRLPIKPDSSVLCRPLLCLTDVLGGPQACGAPGVKGGGTALCATVGGALWTREEGLGAGREAGRRGWPARAGSVAWLHPYTQGRRGRSQEGGKCRERSRGGEAALQRKSPVRRRGPVLRPGPLPVGWKQ